MSPSGVRLGTPALTSRNFKEADFVKVADHLHRCVQIALQVQERSGAKLMKDFVVALANNEEIAVCDVRSLLNELYRSNLIFKALRHEVEVFARSFPMPGL